MAINSIAILFNENSIPPEYFVIHYLANQWRNGGIDVQYLFGTKKFIPADILIMHVSLSVVPERFLRFARRYPRVLNNRITDIRKSRISTGILTADSNWEGQVIVKTDLNNYGRAEKLAGRNWLERRSALARRLRCAIDRRVPATAPFADMNEYKIFSNLSDVPQSWFSSKDIIIEKFRPEIEGNLYHLRMFQALGKQTLCTKLSSLDPTLKTHNSIQSERIEEHPIVHEWRETLGLDYGKLDYVIFKGEPILLDVNKTTGSSPERSNFHCESHTILAKGIFDYA